MRKGIRWARAIDKKWGLHNALSYRPFFGDASQYSAKERSEGRVSNPRLPVTVAKPVKTPPLGIPAERISRRSREHRPTLGALESPQVTPMCLLGDSRWRGAVQA